MKSSIRAFLACVLLATSTLYAQHDEKEGWFRGNYGWLELRHKVLVQQGTNNLLRDVMVGDFSIGGNASIFRSEDWNISLTPKFQSMYGGFRDERAKIHAVNYFMELEARKKIAGKDLYLFFSSLHQSTHLADPIPLKTPEDIRDYNETKFSISDINLIKIGVGSENSIYAWRVGVQPFELKYFLFAEPKMIFKSTSYNDYGRRLYGFLVYSIWEEEESRIVLSGEGNFEWSAEYLIELRYSLQKAKNLDRDGLQLFLAFEGGGAVNEIRTTSFSGISMNRVMFGMKLFW